MKPSAKPKILAYREVEWTEEIDEAIGTASDSIIGRRFGISPRSILVRRRKLGLIYDRTKAEEVVWTKKMEKKLGTMPDTELAKLLKMSPYWVRKRRQELQIEAHLIPENPKSVRKKGSLKLTPGRIASLGKSSDAFLARRWGVSAGTVTVARQKLGIEPHTHCQEIEWTKAMIHLLGEVPDGRIARDYKISDFAVKIKRIEMKILPFGKSEMDLEPDLPPDAIVLIGKIPDKHIADRFKISRASIRLYRAFHSIGLAEYIVPTMHTWKEKELELLGTMSDGALARKLNIPRVQVCHQRRRLDIAPFDRKGTIRWTKDIIDQLGQQPDQELARRWKIPQRDVTKKRESLGIAECKSAARHWSKKELKLLGTMLDTELAEQLGISATLVGKKRAELKIPALKSSGPFDWKPEMLKRLGQVPDDQLALEIGLSYQFVAEKRLELGLPAKRRSSLKWTDQIIKKMGKVSDAAIALELGCSTTLVQLKRNELGIAPFMLPKP